MAMNFDPRKFEALLRTHFRPLLRRSSPPLPRGNCSSLEAIARQFERVRRGEIRRLIINVPPRSLKSITASVAYPAFVLGRDPSRRIICVSYSGILPKSIRTIFTEIVVTENGKTRRLEVMLRRLVNDAMRSDAKAMKLLFALVDRCAETTEDTEAKVQLGELLAEDQAILAQYLLEPKAPLTRDPAELVNREEEGDDD